MPRDFTKCQEKGGKVRTISGPNKQFELQEGEYRPVCWLNNEPYWGEKHKKGKNEKGDRG